MIDGAHNDTLAATAWFVGLSVVAIVGAVVATPVLVVTHFVHRSEPPLPRASLRFERGRVASH